MKRLQQIFADLCEQQKSILIEFNGEELIMLDLLVNLSPDNHIAEFIKVLKASSSRLIRKEFKPHVDKFYWKPVFWSSSYFVNSSGGVWLDVLKRYYSNIRILPVTSKSCPHFHPQVQRSGTWGLPVRKIK